MRTTKAVSISLLPAELKLAERLAKQTNRSLSGLFREGLKRLQDERRTLGRLADEYTPAQRQAIDADIAASMEDFEQGRFHGPFDEGCLVASRFDSNRGCARGCPQGVSQTIGISGD
jgi:hypothetical protein